MRVGYRWGFAVLAAGCGASAPESPAAGASETPNSGAFRADVWADNWSSMYVDGELVMQDSVSIETERSFNEEVFTFSAERPFVVAVELKDFKENDSGLEYIGQRKQQMGDGGYIAQFTDSDGAVVAVSNGDWRCFVTHQAPLDKSCESSTDPLTECEWNLIATPADWTAADFDDSSWPEATVHSARSVDPKRGYDNVTWDAAAQFIWGPDLESDNTVLCRFTVQ